MKKIFIASFVLLEVTVTCSAFIGGGGSNGNALFANESFHAETVDNATGTNAILDTVSLINGFTILPNQFGESAYFPPNLLFYPIGDTNTFTFIVAPTNGSPVGPFNLFVPTMGANPLSTGVPINGYVKCVTGGQLGICELTNVSTAASSNLDQWASLSTNVIGTTNIYLKSVNPPLWNNTEFGFYFPENNGQGFIPLVTIDDDFHGANDTNGNHDGAIAAWVVRKRQRTDAQCWAFLWVFIPVLSSLWR